MNKHNTTSAAGLYYGFVAIILAFILFIAITQLGAIGYNEASDCLSSYQSAALEEMNNLDCALGQ
jgi:hypothetical protein